MIGSIGGVGMFSCTGGDGAFCWIGGGDVFGRIAFDWSV